MKKRREFIKNMALGTAGIIVSDSIFGGIGEGFNAKSYNNIHGANNKIRISTIGVNSRGNSVGGTFAKQANCEIAVVCDVDSRAIPKAIKTIMDAGHATAPKAEKDFRKVLEDKSIDAIYIGTPDHWHSPMTIMGCQAGKHVYVEKPLSHNPDEGELAIAAARKYNRIVQLGTQRRSGPIITQGIRDLHDGIIGRVYLAKTFYTNTRKSNFLSQGTVPEWLDYELWQGPAPRVPYKEGLIHYNWHWFWHWGTGEALNNGTHEVDVARWGLQVDFPVRVSSVGGRYQFRDDWETPDTQAIIMDYPGRVSLIWESRSSNGRRIEGAERGCIFYGEKGSMDMTGGDEYQVYDTDGKLIKQARQAGQEEVQGRNLASSSAQLDHHHVANFLDVIRNNKKPNADVEIGHKSCLAMQLGNISWRMGRDLNIDPKTGHILNDKEAMKLWKRDYEKGWEPKV
jgi:predicted dehydrogenase